jgi:hypothetical protein
MPSHENPTFTTFLSQSNTFIETLTINSIEAQPGLVELTVKTQFLTAKNPDELQVKFRACVSESRLEELRDSITQFLEISQKRDGDTKTS